MGIATCVIATVKMYEEKNDRFEAIKNLVNNSSLDETEVLSLIGIRIVELDKLDKNETIRLDKKDKPENIPVNYKHCYICGQVKDKVEGFYKGQSRCKKCHHVYYKYNTRSRKYHSTLK